jgi:hypothetical protein
MAVGVRGGWRHAKGGMAMKRAATLLVWFQLQLVGAYAQVAVNSATTLLIDQNEPVAGQKAAADLAADMQKVLGAHIQVVQRPADAKATTILMKVYEGKFRTPDLGEIRVSLF